MQRLRLPSSRATMPIVAALAVLVCGSALAMGGALPMLFLPFAGLALLLAGFSLVTLEKSTNSLLPVFVLFALAGYCALQALPLPMSWLESLSPTAADVWKRALMPMGETVQRAPLSLDPTASLLEAIKWATYGATFFTSLQLARRRGPLVGLYGVLAATVLLALVSLGHGVLSATTVFGIYRPEMNVIPGHVGPLLNPNNLSGYLNVGALVCMGLLLSRQQTISRSLLLAAALVLVAVSLRTGSRGGIAALTVGAFALVSAAVLSRRSKFVQRRFVGYASAALLAIAGVFAVYGADAFFWGSMLSDNFDKVQMPRWTLPLVRDYPWFGVGRGSFQSAFFAYRPPTTTNIAFEYPENFLVQWVTEWGVPVSVIAFATLCWAFARNRIGVGRSAVAMGAACGVGALLLQNLVDLSLELPSVGILLATTLGSLWGGARLAPKFSMTNRLRVVVGIAILGSLALIPCLLVAGPSPVANDRERVRDLLTKRAAHPSDEARQALRAAIRRESLRHPADYYFPLIGAYQARLDGENPIPWIQRALERGPTVGRTHLLLGEILFSHGAEAQGLLELRLACEYEPLLAEVIAGAAVRQTKKAEQLMRVVPDGASGVEMLSRLALALPNEADRASREYLDEAALLRDPRLVDQRSRLVEQRLRLLREGETATNELCLDRAACLASISQHIEAIDAAAPTSTRAIRYRAEQLTIEGHNEAALEQLESGCARPIERDVCLRLRIETLSRAGSSSVQAALDAYPDAVCISQPACAEAHAWVARYRIGLGQRQTGVSSLEKAARLDPTPARWLELADAAESAGLIPTAIAAAEEAANRGGRTPALESRLTRLRTQPQR